MIAISYRNDDDERVKTELYKDNGGRLGEEIMIKRWFDLVKLSMDNLGLNIGLLEDVLRRSLERS